MSERVREIKIEQSAKNLPPRTRTCREDRFTGDSRNKTRPAKVVVVANSKQKVVSSTHKVVKYAPKNFGYDYTLYWQNTQCAKAPFKYDFFIASELKNHKP